MKKIYTALFMFSLYLGLHNGYLALWDTQYKQPEQVFPYRAALYPKADMDALSEGIPITDAATLEKLLEDFMS